MNTEEFKALLKPVTDLVAASDINQQLATSLNAEFPADGALFATIENACHEAISEGWMWKL